MVVVLRSSIRSADTKRNQDSGTKKLQCEIVALFTYPKANLQCIYST